MNNEKEHIEGELMDGEIEVGGMNQDFDPNSILNTIMQSQDLEFRNVFSKLSISTLVTKATVVFFLIGFLLAGFFNYVGVASGVYGLYCTLYVLINYKKVKQYEDVITGILAKNNESFDIKKNVLKNLLILLLCIPLAILSFYYREVFMK